MGLLSTMLPIAASFIPGVGPYLGPALGAGMNIAQGGGILNSLAGAGLQIGLNKLPGMFNQGGQASTGQFATKVSTLSDDIIGQMAEQNLRRLSGSFSQGMMGGL
jgi:hypothetical protein